MNNNIENKKEDYKVITDIIENAENYYKLGENFKKGFEFLKNTNLKELENGKYQIDNDDVFVSVQDYTTKPESEGKFEAHKKYADIQFIISGEEKIGYTNIQNCTPTTFYDDTKDIVFLEGKGDFITARENSFLIFMPQDAHMPCISNQKPQYVKKAVVKVKIS